MEDSADLLFAEDAQLNPLQQLQRARLQRRLGTGVALDLRPAWSAPRIAATWIAGALAIAALFFWPTRQTTTILAPSTENLPVVAGVPRLVAQRLRIVPPAYTGLPARDEASLDAKAPQGSRLQWTLHFEPQPVAADLIFHDGTRVALTREGDDWSVARNLDKSVLYRVSPSGAEKQPAPPLHRLDAISDAPPQSQGAGPRAQPQPGRARPAQLGALRSERRLRRGGERAAAHHPGAGRRREHHVPRTHDRRSRGTGSRQANRFAPQLDLAALGCPKATT